MVKIEGSLDEIHALLGAGGSRSTKKARSASTKAAAPSKKKAKRKPSAYNLHMKKELPKLRKKHPRSTQAALMKKAAASWRKKRGKK